MFRPSAGGAPRHSRFTPTMFCMMAVFLALTLRGPARSLAAQSRAAEGSSATWRFAVAGDSRNCGNVILPAIAAAARARGVAFFWDLGDFRAMLKPDEDFQDQSAKPATDLEYQEAAWNDFIENQLLWFREVPVFLAIGNHELYNHTRSDYLRTFRKWLEAPPIVQQRLVDHSPDDPPTTYYHWIRAGIDFIALDNASDDQFDAAQMAWFESVLAKARTNPAIRTIVVGMHKPLPDSISNEHSMNESGDLAAIQSGRQVYRDLLQAQNEFHKTIYILASHSHYYMEGSFNTEFWKGNVLPGWIVGTAGAQRTQLPGDWRHAKSAMQGVYGYLLATVNPDDGNGHAAPGAIRFEFHLINRSDLPIKVRKKFSPGLIDFCFDQNMRQPERF